MSRIEITIEEFQGMRDKIKKLESALNTVSQEAATNKEIIEQAKALVEDLKSESIFSRLFKWNDIIKPIEDFFGKKNGKIQKTEKK